MKRSLFNLAVVCLALFLLACQHSEKPETAETAFFRNFNLGATVEKMNVVQLQPRTGSCPTTTSIGEIAERRRGCVLEYLLNERNSGRFDEAVFLNELKSEIARQISDAGVRVNGSGTGDNSFHFDYLTKGSSGSIDAIGARVEENKYMLWCVVRETAGIESDK